MKTYIYTHPGHYPVGACSVVRAKHDGAAADQLIRLLKDEYGTTRGEEYAQEAELAWVTGCDDKVILNGDY